ncbi:dNA repair protein RecN [Acetobacter sp. CAG:977]|nr:dNA repair protein RecN [Acetobacter sp. CAG:977]
MERLAGEDCQVLAITHSPQVASFGAHHFKVSKAEDETGRTLTAVCELTGDARREEIARMLSGASITEASRAAADELLKGRI